MGHSRRAPIQRRATQMQRETDELAASLARILKLGTLKRRLMWRRLSQKL